MTVARTYARAQTETASRERLMVMLLQTALRHMYAGARHFKDKQLSPGITATAKAQEIVMELMSTLDTRQAPELCESLISIYSFVLDRLMKGLVSRTSEPLLEAARAFSPIAQAFAEAVQKMEPAAPAASAPR